jgi:hypothetical protein
LTLGVVAEGDVPAPVVNEPAEGELTVDAVAAAIRALMAEGDTKAFGVTGEPKLVPLSKQAGSKVTDELRDAAWVIVKSED